MNRIVSKISLFLCLSMLLILPVFLNGCKTNQPTESRPSNLNLEYSSYFSASLYPVSHVGDDDSIIGVFTEEYAILTRSRYPEGYWDAELRFWQDSLYLSQGGYTDEYGEPIAPSASLELYDYFGKLINTIHLGDYFSPSWVQPCVYARDGDSILVVMTCANTDNLDVVYEYAYFDFQGKLVGVVKELKPQDYMTISYFAYANAPYADLSGNIYLCGYKVTENEEIPCVFIFSDKGILRETIELKNRFALSFVTDGSTLYIASSSTDTNGSMVAIIEEIDDKTFSLGKTYTIPDVDLEYTEIDADSSSIYFCDQQKITRYSLQSQETDTILVLSDVDAQRYGVVDMACLTRGKIAILGHSTAMGTENLIVFTGQDTDPNMDKQTLILAGVDITDDPIINEIVFRFNMSHSEFRIQIFDYGAAYPYSEYGEERYSKIYEDFYIAALSGNGPDILIDPYNTLPFLSLSRSKHMIDMSKYLFNNKDINISDYQEEHFNSSMVDGKLFSLSSAYSIFGLLGAANEDTPIQWTIDEYNAAIAADVSGSIPIIGSSSAELLKGSLEYSLDEYIDFETAEVNFDSEAFIQLLEWAKHNADQSQIDPGSAVANGSARYCVWGFDSVFNYLDTCVLMYDCDFSFVPFPTETGESLLARPKYRFAITAQCPYPDAAWDCVSELLCEDMQKVLSRVYIPLRYDALEWAIKESESFSTTDFERTQQITSKFYLYATEANSISYTDKDCVNLILEEANAFFADQKTAEEVAALIQNRAQILVDERQ
ncbi:MAG: hypothetical protein PHF65_06055 [Oscillospiraceae bacterium]|nr:hypothetical protein [Oscillospiraceae bacterium]